MAISKRCPTHPGKILKEHYLKPLKLDINFAAEMLGISKNTLSNILQEKEDVNPEIALRLSKAFDTTPDLWLGLQKNYDLWIADLEFRDEVKKIPKLYVSKWTEKGKRKCVMNPKKKNQEKF